MKERTYPPLLTALYGTGKNSSNIAVHRTLRFILIEPQQAF
jgi:hypothetical protein